ncbi:(3R)-hydroxymyristoyl-[acyl-carrier-protein] dehydratase [Listeria grayi]|uniref:(3R)-hydroxymyristoyl-ACP dehydratase n=1 Tax=Listeria grayi FSL F6-1183 TaxID=1265827 RepID=A0A829R534_LISGR|nr:hypothetical protein [Listeria grayi]EUJ26796.1 (3R)-hydroxymyristoyl-ACP dehydratase [Listeria grayi FSL F6-1183]MBC1922817.1 hydroxymyristoyl-ACP dehydratase [Listeria grayi]VEI33559.1 (3R)-hydroxymyristoyl-[acyl-carrier-protein] dehydratase [Listeria grayi]
MFLSYHEVGEILPQKNPFRFIDTVNSFDCKSKRIVCKKLFLENEFFFEGHFPEAPITPGVLIIESMAQSAILLENLLKKREIKFEKVYLSKVIDAVFKKSIKPNTLIYIETYLNRTVTNFHFVSSKVYNEENDIIAKATLIVSIKGV